MPNWVSNRLTLSGPSDEIERFRKTCFQVQPEDGEIGFDFGSLKPMPSEIEATIDDRSDTAKQAAFAATGFDGWYGWCNNVWGSKWNSSDLKVIHRDRDIEEFLFSSANSFATPIMDALAQQFPALTGVVVADEIDGGWMVAGLIADGIFSGGRGDPIRPFCHMIEAAGHDPVLFGAMVRGLATRSRKELRAAPAWPFGALVGICTRGLWKDICCELPTGYARRLDLSVDAERVCAFHNEDDRHFHEVDFDDRPSLEEFLGATRSAAYFQTAGRTWSRLDRHLMRDIARILVDVWPMALSDDAIDTLVETNTRSIAETTDESELRVWACHALFRPGVHVDFSTKETLVQSFVDYAVLRRSETTRHLESVEEDHGLRSEELSIPLPRQPLVTQIGSVASR